MPGKQLYRTIVAHVDEDEREEIVALLREEGIFDVFLSTGNGTECIRQAMVYQPDLIVLDSILLGVDGLGVMQQVKSCCNTKILFTTNHKPLMKHPDVLTYADYSILTPCCLSLIITRAVNLVRVTSWEDFTLEEIKTATANLLAELRFPRHLKGYSYISDGVVMAVLDSNIIYQHTGPNGLYAKLTRRHRTDFSKVERCIRVASGYVLKNTPLSILEKYFPPEVLENGRVQNIELIAILSDLVGRRLREERKRNKAEQRVANLSFF